MHPFYEEFLNYLDNEEKENCVEFIISKLENKELNILTLYSEILGPALNQFHCDLEEEKLCIWREHIRKSIIRTITEICYQYILKERKERGKAITDIKILVGCPAEEYCNIEAKMISDIFTFYGFDSIFIGADLPRSEIRDAINLLKPQIITLSITNYYNLIEAEKAIKLIKEHTDFKGKIVVGGLAFLSNPEIYKKIGADYLIRDYDEIERIVGGI